MAKKIMKAKNHPPFPAPKRGKARALRKPASILKKPASSTKIPYVRHGDPTTKTRNVRARWGISVQMLLKKKTLSLIKLLQKDGILPKMKTCPHCGEKSLTSLQYSDIKGIYAYRCNRKAWFSPIAFTQSLCRAVETASPRWQFRRQFFSARS